MPFSAAMPSPAWLSNYVPSGVNESLNSNLQNAFQQFPELNAGDLNQILLSLPHLSEKAEKSPELKNLQKSSPLAAASSNLNDLSGHFHWSLLEDGRSDGNMPDQRKDDGVVLLVGLFNLLAVLVYAGQQLLTGSFSGSDKRVILWQVQKVLDELILRVHSSDTAADLLSRAFKTSVNSSTAKTNQDSISNFLIQTINEKDPKKLKGTLNKIKENFLEEISSSEQALRGPKIDPKIYGPLESLYKKVTEPSRRGRAFSTSLLQEAKAVVRTVSDMNLEEIQSVLKVITSLGRMQRHYDVSSILQSLYMSPSRISNDIETVYGRKNLKNTRFRRAVPQLRKYNGLRQRLNGRLPKFSRAELAYKARRMKEFTDKHLQKLLGSKNEKEKRQEMKTKLERRLGTAVTVLGEDSTNGWADGWFTILTQTSPVALDLSTVYTRARTQPKCLRGLLCKANAYWRKRGAFQATLVPFLSILASWAMEDITPHSLGDSLIAVRAGWMGKHCSQLYPECPRKEAPHPLAEQASYFFDSVKKNEFDNFNSGFASKSGEIILDTESYHHEPEAVPLKNTTPLPSTTTTQQSTTTPYMPYDRYDRPAFSSREENMPSGSVSGMDLQDRPVEKFSIDRMDMVKEFDYPTDEEELDENEQEEIHSFSNEVPYNSHSGVPIREQTAQSMLYQPQTQKIFSDWQNAKEPFILHDSDYSNYMKNQKPAFVKQNHRNIHMPIVAKQPKSITHSVSQTHKNTSPNVAVKHMKYKYGLRRGLPAKNVNGHSPLTEKSINKFHSKPSHTEPQHQELPLHEISNNIRESSQRYFELMPKITPTPKVKNIHKSSDTLEGKHVSQFGPADAITDPFKNELLFQYIRDRHFTP